MRHNPMHAVTEEQVVRDLIAENPKLAEDMQRALALVRSLAAGEAG